MAQRKTSFFTHLSKRAAQLAGRPATFATAALAIVAWALAGPLFGFSEGWQLSVNSATTIITFLMVFLIQATQNRESEAIHLKLDEILRVHEGARKELIDSEEMDEKELQRLHRRYQELAEHTRTRLAGRGKTGARAR